jgi:glycerate 2-kinase
VLDLETIYLRTLEACAPERLVVRVLEPGIPRDVVAIGKCAGALLDGLRDVDEAFVAVPEGYRDPKRRAQIHRGGHPQITAASFAAGRAMVEFVDAHENILFLISGGGSACVELPLTPWFHEEEVIDTNRRLLASGAPIGEMNCVRKHLSALKGGRLAARVHGSSVTLIYSDVSAGALADVASGPTLADPSTKDDAIRILERIGGLDPIIERLRGAPETVKHIERGHARLIADNDTLTKSAASIAPNAIRCEHQIEGDVADAAAELLRRANQLRRGQVLVAGGEPTVAVTGDGKGGRCCELAVRVALEATEPMDALFASSDGVDGNSGVAGFHVSLPVQFDRAAARRELARSNSLAVAASIGKPLATVQSGNNLRDLYLLARS